jgi:hypothetical protein
MSFPLILPWEAEVTPDDTIRAFVALDSTTTGAHEIATYVCFADRAPRMKMHAGMTTVQDQSTSSVTRAGTAVTIDTVAGKCREIVGLWGYIQQDAGLTAAQSTTGWVEVESQAAGWITQEFPLNYIAAGLGANIDPIFQPAVYLTPDIISPPGFQPNGCDFYIFPQAFPMQGSGKERFSFYGVMDGGNTDAPGARFGLIYRE